jgi:hypothetical protein
VRSMSHRQMRFAVDVLTSARFAQWLAFVAISSSLSSACSGDARPDRGIGAAGADGDPDPIDQACEVGSEGCPCTGGGACDTDLTCSSKLCVRAGSADEPGLGGAGDGTESETGGSAGATGGSAGATGGSASARAAARVPGRQRECHGRQRRHCRARTTTSPSLRLGCSSLRTDERLLPNGERRRSARRDLFIDRQPLSRQLHR